MKKSIALLALAAVIITSAGISMGASMVASKSASATIRAQNKSGEKGSATLVTWGASSTKVTISVTGEPAGASQPAHIHTGTCAKLGGVAYPLNNVEGGKSATIIKTPLATILKTGTAINIHKSKRDIAKYVACGAIKS